MKLENLKKEDASINQNKLTKILLDRPPPHCSAQSWVVFDRSSRQVLFGRLEKDRRETESLTKIMTD